MNNQETFLKRQGYNYYVYVSPGNISYFYSYAVAQEYAEQVGASVSNMEA